MRAFTVTMFLACLMLAGGVNSEEPSLEQFVDVPPPPPAPAESYDEDVEDAPEPEVTIIQKEDATYEEYRLNGRLYMVKVKPAIGPPYYFIDRDGDGLMETRMNDRATQIKVPQWVIFSW